MDYLISILKRTQGIFISANEKSPLTSDIRNNTDYISVADDKKNMRNDVVNFAGDLKKSLNEAKSKYAIN
jgi:hypothetical protein